MRNAARGGFMTPRLCPAMRGSAGGDLLPFERSDVYFNRIAGPKGLDHCKGRHGRRHDRGREAMARKAAQKALRPLRHMR